MENKREREMKKKKKILGDFNCTVDKIWMVEVKHNKTL